MTPDAAHTAGARAARPRWVAENAPLAGVVAILLAAFAALMLWGGGGAPATGPQAGGAESTPAIPAGAPALTALPGNADDTLVVASALDPDSARARNAAVPFAAEGPGTAPAFAFRGSAADRVRARDCLALAAMAEAGSGDPDQRAVIQVILNRVRHPAFAKTVCGVVFEGSHRPTGCQFSFTCDGSLARVYPEARWAAARRRADEALGGYVEKAVGNATHYHTDWVYPWWSGKLDKIAQVNTHLFLRWRGFWGSTRALSARYAGGEPDPNPLKEEAQAVAAANPIPGLAASFGQGGAALRTITAAPDTGAADIAPTDAGDTPRAAASGAPETQPAPGVHFVLVSAADRPARLVERAQALCTGNAFCQVYGWDDAAAVPARLPLDRTARAALRFSFLAGRSGQAPVTYFDCRLWADPGVGSCLPRAAP